MLEITTKSPRGGSEFKYRSLKGMILISPMLSKYKMQFNKLIPWAVPEKYLIYLGYTLCNVQGLGVNKLKPRQDGRHFADDIFKRNFLNEKVWISINISLKFIPKGPIKNIAALVHNIAWRWPGDKPLSEPMMVWFTDAYICSTRPQWVNMQYFVGDTFKHFSLTHCGLVMPYGDRDLGQHWLR